LNPNDPDDGIPWTERVALKNGDERVNAIRTRLQRVGRANGIEFSFNSKIGKTRDSHRLIQFAPPESRKALLEAIFEAHFEHDADITSHSDLVKAAVAAGMDEEGVAALLRSDEGATEIDESAARARKSGVSSVPTIEINGYRIEGAEDASEFYEALVNAKNEQS
jgi:predicted DsbA family dithiol-disulfide isomerase